MVGGFSDDYCMILPKRLKNILEESNLLNFGNAGVTPWIYAHGMQHIKVDTLSLTKFEI